MEKEEINKLKQQLEEQAKSINIKEREFLEVEKNAEKRFNKNIGKYVPHKKYENLKDYIKIITDSNSRINCLVIKGEQGVGKSTAIKSIMKEMKKDFYYLNSYTTSLAFYINLYENRFKHIIIDDLFGIFQDEKGISILRAITNTEKVRYVKYQSTSEKLSVPSSFIFEGSIIILTNHLTEKMDKSLLDRAIFREINFTLNEKLEFMERIIRFNYKNLNDKEVEEICNFIKENVNETTKNFTFRTILRICEFYIHNKGKWKELGLEELKEDEELKFVKKIMNLPTEIRNKNWVEITGKSVRTLRRKINKIKENRTNGHLVKNA